MVLVQCLHLLQICRVLHFLFVILYIEFWNTGPKILQTFANNWEKLQVALSNW